MYIYYEFWVKKLDIYIYKRLYIYIYICGVHVCVCEIYAVSRVGWADVGRGEMVVNAIIRCGDGGDVGLLAMYRWLSMSAWEVLKSRPAQVVGLLVGRGLSPQARPSRRPPW